VSAIRYSGALRVRVTLEDVDFTKGRASEEYRCFVTLADRNHVAVTQDGERARGVTVYVKAKLEPGSGIGLDSPEQFDSVARAAISFAAHEGWPADEYAAMDQEYSGWYIGRTLAKAWPSPDSRA
jgi:hypothetical protein